MESPVVESLDTGENMNGIDPTGSRTGKDGDQNMFFQTEGPRIE